MSTRCILTISVLMPLLVLCTAASAPGAWFNSAWQFRKVITINAGQVPATLNNFPLLVKTTDTHLLANAELTGIDIRFTADDGTSLLDYEIESYNGTTGLVAWVRIPILSSTADTEIYMYYGNSGATSQENPTGVWDTNYVMVHHLEETSGNHINSASSTGTNDGIPTITGPPGTQGSATGRINGADELDGNDYVNCGDDASLKITGSMTVEAWAYSENGTATSTRIACKDPQGSVGKFILWKDALGDLEFMVADVSSAWYRIQGNPVADGAWFHVVGVFDAGSQEVRLYKDGLQVNSLATGAITLKSTDETFTIGAASNNTHYWNGTIDEVRVSNTARSADWILTNYNNQNAPGTFYGIGTLELPCTVDTECGICEKCDTFSGSCVFQADTEDNKLECSDVDACLTGFCDGAGACGVQASGTPCTDDLNECTDDVCDGAGICLHNNNTAPCDDSLFCNGTDICSAGVCTHSGDPCGDDGLFCTGTESCDETGDQCVSSGDPCGDDGLFCTGTESCDETGDQCVSSGDPCGDDGLFCTGTESCDETGDQCVSSGDPCGDDGLFCTGTESCDETGDQCVSSGDPCGDDGQFCNGTESCDEVGDQCVNSGDPCAGGDACNSSCNESGDNCFNTSGTSCEDNLFCTQTDTCDGSGSCVGSGNPCPDDAVFCNGTESCDEVGDQCVSSGDPCAGGSECNNACQEATDTCFNPTGTACTDDGNVCTDDECNGTGTCVHTNNSDPCDDTIACTENDECSAGSCGGTPNDSLCDDSDVCTSDTCDSVTDCANTPIVHTVSLSPDPLNLGSPGEQGVITALVDESSVPVAGEIVTFSESADPSGATDLYPMVELDILGEAVVQIHGLQAGTGTLNVTAVDMNGDELLGVNYTLGAPVDGGCATRSGSTLNIVSAPCDTEMTVTCDDGVDPIVGYLIASIEPSSAAVTVEVVPVTDSAGQALLLVKATAEGQATVSGSATCGSGAATVNVAECNDDLDCSLCEKCNLTNNTCEFQTALEDTKDECLPLECSTGFCDGAGACGFETLGTACTDDGNECTDDECDGAGLCVNTNNTAPCDDGDACTTADTCSGGSCVGGAALTCDDGNLCTDDSCAPATGCVFVDNTVPCDDADACTTNDTCAAGSCIGGPALTCDDGNLCTDDSCAPASGCVFTNNTLPCNDGLFCTVSDQCSGGNCGGSARDCSGVGDQCNDGVCNEGADACEVQAKANGTPCDDGVYCNGDDQCGSGSCIFHTFIDPCSGGSECNDQCDEVTDTCFNPIGTACTDDGNECTDDQCDGAGACLHPNNTAPCDDGNPCTTADTCAVGSCVGGSPLNCDDGNVCTDDSCDPGTGCVYTNNALPCDDGVYCNGDDQCGSGSCIFHTFIDPCSGGSDCNNQCDEITDTCFNPAGSPCTDDGNECTDDECDGTGACLHPDNTATCDDGLYCTQVDECQNGQCIGSSDPCDDNGSYCDGVEFCQESTGDYLCTSTGNPCGGSLTCNDAGETCDVSDVTLIVGDSFGTPGTIDIELENAAFVSEVHLDICDADLRPWLQINTTSCSITSRSTLLSCSIIDSGGGCVQVDLTGGVIDPGTGAIIQLSYTLDTTAPVGDFADLVPQNYNVQDDTPLPLSVTPKGGTVGALECQDDNDCEICEKCNLTFNTCEFQADTEDVKLECSDVDLCLTGFCDGAGACGVESAGTFCTDDSNECTDDVCDGAGICLHTNNTASCDDGDACTTADTCSGGSCVGGAPPNCNDGNVCTDDSCDTVIGCVNANNTAACDDGDACTTLDTCAGGACVGGVAPNCDDGNVCTDDSCDTVTGCVNTNNVATCDDGDACTTLDTCAGGACVGGAPPNCDDGNVCTDDSCNPASGCVNANNTVSCSDGNACTTADTCSGGTCVGGAPPNCNDGNVCTDDSCNPATGCVNTNNVASCDDGDACTTADTCAGGACVGGAPPDCDDSNLCTDDSCDTVTGCVNTNNTTSCDDGDACTTADTCAGGACVGGAAPNCDDGNVCTDDSCDTLTGCVNANNTVSCDDGDACTTADTCAGGACVGGAAPNCDDGNVCTDDSCDTVTGCVNTNNTVSCDDGDACTTADTCAGGACVGGVPPNCDDSDVCTDDSCSPATGCVNTPIVYTINLSPDPLNLSAPGEQGVITALVEENSVAEAGEIVTFVESADPGNATDLYPMGELDINGDAVVTIHGLQAGTGTLSVTAVNASGGVIPGVTYTLADPLDSGCAILSGNTLTIDPVAPCDTEMTVTCEDSGSNPIVGYLIATIDPVSTAVVVEALPVTNGAGEARLLVEALVEGQATVSGSVTCGAAADTATVNVSACNDDSDCGFCEKCNLVNNTCIFQTVSEDLKGECSPGVCSSGLCDGSGACGFLAATTECRPSAGSCDVAENCTGSSAVCPTDGFEPATTECRASVDVCDAAEYCTGSAGACPADGFEPATTECRASVDVCDAAEYCTGSSGLCPADGFEPTTTECRPSVDTCDIAETCTGSSNACPPDVYHIFGTGCRASGGVCDIPEVCTGASPVCPADVFVQAGTECRTSAGVCDVAEVCTGFTPSCPVDVFQPSTVECRPWAGVCDVAENCTGTSATCPIDGSEPNGTSCNDNIYCNGTDTCNNGICQHSGDPCPGTQCNSCQENLDSCLDPAGTSCGDNANTDCTNPDTCNGAGICLSNHASAGSSCSDDGNQCTDDQCNGVGICTHPFLSAGSVCGDQSLTDCTAPDACDGSGFCLANHAPAGIPCTSDGISTTEDICGYSGTCSHFSSSWARVYEGSGRDYARAIYQTFDLGYITAGYTQSFGAGGDDLWVLKLDATGDVNWQKSFGGTETDQAHAVTQTLDGGYIIGGYTRSFGAGGDDLLVLKLGAGGNVIWQKTYGGTGSDRVYSIHETPDGGCIMAAATDSSGEGDYDIWIIKLDSNGDISWHRTYGGSAADEAFAIDQTSDGGYIVAGITSSFGVGGKDGFALKLQNDGDISWFKTYGGSDYDYTYAVTETSEGDYIVAGYSLSFSSNADMWVVKLDSDGGIIWQKRFGGGGLDQAYSVEQTPDGNCVVTGTTLSFGAGARDMVIFELDEVGNIAWEQTAGGVSDEYVYSINRTFPDDGYSLAGRTASFGASASGFAVLKFDDTGAAADCDILNSSNLNSANTSGDYRNVSVLWTSFVPVVTNVMTSSQNSLADEVVVCGPAVGNRDSDGDGVLDVDDNCPGVANGDQTNSDSDALGNVCDNCPLTNNPLQENSDSDSLGDACDNCPNSANADQLDSDCDGIGNACDGSLNCTDGVDCDDDCDGFYNQADNCPQGANGPAQGTCLEGYRGQYCLVDAHCGPGGICSQDQDDTAPPQGNGIGDVCDCEGNFDCDSDVDGSDARDFKLDFGRSTFLNPCNQVNPCNGNFDCDSDVDGSDAREFKRDFGRSTFLNPCPSCVVGPWCY